MNEVELLALVKRGRQRKLLLAHLDPEKPLLVSEAQKRANAAIRASGEGKEIRLSDASRALAALRELGLAECLNPPVRRGEKGTLYAISEQGKRLRALL